MPPSSAHSPVVRDGPPAGPGGGGKMCSGVWKRGPENPIGVISLCRWIFKWIFLNDVLKHSFIPQYQTEGK